jgi:predicted regulator of Ras-like GTPase activity (Roadblock/LC7/MglB family)
MTSPLSQSQAMPLTEVERALCERGLSELIHTTSGIERAWIASPDGFEIASATRGKRFNAARLAAMSSSMLAVGSALAGELRLGGCRNVIVEAEQGQLVLFTIPCSRAQLVLSALAPNSSTLGLVLVATRACAKDIARQLDVGGA